ncbi:Angiopoietin-4 [Oryzias melastigma]|uniref:Angiopoietin-4 n=1 Tax=Oryzias melastigma TaxID=30732 RepID=A0A834CFX5_ORYME|nr:Angiopoietin-4 [Oryzias melastigma]
MGGLSGWSGSMLALLLIFSMQTVSGSGNTGAPPDCSYIQTFSPNGTSGVYNIQPEGFSYSFEVYCEMGANGIWTVIQKRTGGAVAFDREWAAYKNGFGFISRDHWLGLEKISAMTKSKRWKLRVDLWDFEGGSAYAEYEDFRVGDESTNYRLSVGRYRGTAGDAIRGAYHGVDQNGFGFSTIDRDNDGCDPCLFGDVAVESCTSFERGGWWYSKCGSANLNGHWYPEGENIGWLSGLHWLTWKGPAPYSAKATRMMITPLCCLRKWFHTFSFALLIRELSEIPT